jgi:hypothetical protein
LLACEIRRSQVVAGLAEAGGSSGISDDARAGNRWRVARPDGQRTVTGNGAA